MKNIKNVKKIMLVMLIIVLALFVLQTIVSATQTPIDITNSLGNANSGGSVNNLPNLTSNVENSQVNNTTNNAVNNTTNNTKTNNVINNTEKLPQTGLTEDITIMFFIVLCVASAVFAYVKIRRYNDR